MFHSSAAARCAEQLRWKVWRIKNNSTLLSIICDGWWVREGGEGCILRGGRILRHKRCARCHVAHPASCAGYFPILESAKSCAALVKQQSRTICTGADYAVKCRCCLCLVRSVRKCAHCWRYKILTERFSSYALYCYHRSQNVIKTRPLLENWKSYSFTEGYFEQ